MRTLSATLAAALLAAAVAACTEEGGEEIDTAIEETLDGEADPAEGAFERAGEILEGEEDVEDLEDVGEEIVEEGPG